MGSDPIYRDAQGRPHPRAAPDARIASLVPSITELVCDLGLAPQLVARTGFCIHPRARLADIPKAGGTKDVDIARLRALAPSHVIVNIDENPKPVADEIASFVPHVIVTHPNAPLDNLALYRLIGGIFDREAAAERLCDALTTALGAALKTSSRWPRENVLYLIWKDPWMTVARDTYISRSLAVVGWDTLPAGVADAAVPKVSPASPTSRARYPQVDLVDAARDATVVLLSSEPYLFRAAHVHALQAELDAILPGRRVLLIDGEMTSWYGSRAVQGLTYLPRFRAEHIHNDNYRKSNSGVGVVGQKA